MDELRLHGISDVHLGSFDCDEEMFLAYLKEIEKDPAARVILNGDLLQYDTKGSKGDVYRQKYPPSQQKSPLQRLTSNRLVGILPTNPMDWDTLVR